MNSNPEQASNFLPAFKNGGLVHNNSNILGFQEGGLIGMDSRLLNLPDFDAPLVSSPDSIPPNVNVTSPAVTANFASEAIIEELRQLRTAFSENQGGQTVNFLANGQTVTEQEFVEMYDKNKRTRRI
jgi:hypothetical protein